MDWRLAESLKKLREQINAAYPGRDKVSDGAIGDADHASRNSDHNPWIFDGRIHVVSAIDIDEDLTGSIHSLEAMITAIRQSRDPRVKYIIYEGRITVAGTQLQQWKPYTGKNAHRHHAHISVFPARNLYDDRREWSLGLLPVSLVMPELETHSAVEIPTILPISEPASEAAPSPTANAAEQAQPPSTATQQTAENITNVQTGDKTVPDNFVPEKKTLEAPAKEGTTAASAKLTIGGFAVPTFLVGIVAAIRSAIDSGFVSADQIGKVVIDFVSANSKYAFAGIGLVIGGMFLKKLYKQITLWLSMYIAARADMHDVKVKPQ